MGCSEAQLASDLLEVIVRDNHRARFSPLQSAD
jgi:hypothetical protein